MFPNVQNYVINRWNMNLNFFTSANIDFEVVGMFCTYLSSERCR